MDLEYQEAFSFTPTPSQGNTPLQLLELRKEEEHEEWESRCSSDKLYKMFYHVFSYLASVFDNNSSLEPIILWHDTINSAAIHISLISVHKIIEE